MPNAYAGGLAYVPNNAPTFVPVAPTSAAIQSAINAASAAGGGIVQLPAGNIPIATTLVPASGVKLRGIAPQLAYTSIPDANTTTFAAGGTVLTPTGAFPAISWNTTVLGTPASQAAFSQLALTNISFEDIGFSGANGGTYGIFAGATNNASCWWSQFKNLYFIGFATVGFSLTNYQHCEFIGNYSFNCAWGQFHGIDVAAATLAPGNSTYYDLYNVNSSTLGNTSRGITFLTTAALAAAADNNQFKLDRIQSNRFAGGAQTQAATMTNAQATFTVTDGTKYPIGIPVTFSATVNGFTTGKIYFVVTNSVNTISVSLTYGGAAVSATGSTAVNITTNGYPCFEMIALSGSQMTNLVIDNLDVEGLATCAAFFQNSNGVNIQLSQVPGTGQAPISICYRGCTNKFLLSPQSCSTDDDQNALGPTFFHGAKFGASIGYNGIGFVYDSVSGKSGMSLGYQFDGAGAYAITHDPATAGGFMAPRVAGLGHAQTKVISGSITITNLNLAYLNTTASSTTTLPSVVAANQGAWLKFFNNSGATQTIATDGTQLFSNVATRTTLTLNAGASVYLEAMSLNGTFTWVIVGGSGPMSAGVIAAPT